MSWYYAHDGRQVGPVADEEFQKLRDSGTVSDQTLVWQVGMANWLPCGEAVNNPGSPPPSPDSAPPEVKLKTEGIVCTGCGGVFAADDVVRLGDGFVCAGCKPRVLQRMREGLASSEAEEIRSEHIKHEASVKSVGILYLIGGAAVIVLGGLSIFGVVMTRSPGSSSAPVGGIAFFAVILILIGLLQLATGVAIRRLKPWSRVAAGVISGIGLLGFPFGTLINGYILYLLFSQKGKMVFSSEYQAIIEETPHLKYRTSIIVWIFLGLLLLLLFLAVLAPLFARMR